MISYPDQIVIGSLLGVLIICIWELSKIYRSWKND